MPAKSREIFWKVKIKLYLTLRDISSLNTELLSMESDSQILNLNS